MIKKSFSLIIVILILAFNVFPQEDDCVIFRFTGPGSEVLSVAFNDDGSQLAAGTKDRVIIIWDPVTGEKIHIIDDNYFPVRELIFAKNNDLFVASGNDVKLIDKDGYIHKAYKGNATHIWTFDLPGDRSKIITGTYEKKIRIWDAATGDQLLTLEGHEKSTLPVAFSRDGCYAASGSLDRTVRIWNVNTGEIAGVFDRHTDNILSVAFHPSGKYVASGSLDQTIRLWDIEKGEIKRTFVGHNNGITDLDFSPDGNYLLSSSYDYTIRLWDVNTGNNIYSFVDHEGVVNRVAYSPDGKYFASASNDETVILWQFLPRIFAEYYYYDEIGQEKEKSGLFEPRHKGESRKDFNAREEQAQQYLKDLYDKYYQRYKKEKEQ